MWKLFPGISLVTGKGVPPAGCSSHPEKSATAEGPQHRWFQPQLVTFFPVTNGQVVSFTLDLHELAWKRKRKKKCLEGASRFDFKTNKLAGTFPQPRFTHF